MRGFRSSLENHTVNEGRAPLKRLPSSSVVLNSISSGATIRTEKAPPLVECLSTMVKAGKECKGFSPDDEELVEERVQADKREKLVRFATLLQAVYRGWKARKIRRERTSPERTRTLNQDTSESCTLPSAENTREAALQYVYEHRILQLLKNLMSRVFYIRPKDVKEYLMKELQKIYEARRETDARPAAKCDAYRSSEIPEIPEPPQGDKTLGIFDADDFPVYFGLLAGRSKENIHTGQLLRSMLMFSCKSDVEKVMAENKVDLLGTVGEKTFCRIIEESVSGYYDISPWI